MPFFFQFTKVKQIIGICKKSKENFNSLSFGFQFKILNSKIRKL